MKEEGPSTLADLKSKAPYPEVVEPWDTNANDPELLLYFIFNFVMTVVNNSF